jgi:hypothetical protein
MVLAKTIMMARTWNNTRSNNACLFLAALAEQALLVHVNCSHEQRKDNLQELTTLVASANIDAMFVTIADCRVPGVRLFVG